MEGGMDSERRRHARGTGRDAPRLQAIPGALVIPAKAGTYWMRLAYAKAGTYPIAPMDARFPPTRE